MASEDSDQLSPGFLVVHRLSKLRDLDKAVTCEMTTVSHDLEALDEPVKVRPLRRPQRIPPKERDDDVSQIIPAGHAIAVQVLLVIVVPPIDRDAADSEEVAQAIEARSAPRALRDDEAMSHLIPGLVAASAHPVWLPDEAD